MRVEWDKNGAYRDATKNRTGSPTLTFLSCVCGIGKSIVGRKKIGADGRRISWACAGCVK